MTAIGRPRLHDRDTLMAEACDRVASGELITATADSLGIPRQKLSEWGALPEYRDMYARAREAQALAMADDVIMIADGIDVDSKARVEAMLDAIEGVDKDDKDRVLQALTYAAVQRDRIRVDARKWLTAKVYPKVFGDHKQVNVLNPRYTHLTQAKCQETRGYIKGHCIQSLLQATEGGKAPLLP